MSYINNNKNFGTVSFMEIGFNTSIETAREIRNDIISFFTEHPDGRLNIDFGSCERLTPEFAGELFKDKTLKKFIAGIGLLEICDSDRDKIMGALNG